MTKNKKDGRPRIIPDQEVALEIVRARVSFRQARIAKKIGNGNLSEGIRRAIERAAADFEFMDALPRVKK